LAIAVPKVPLATAAGAVRSLGYAFDEFRLPEKPGRRLFARGDWRKSADPGRPDGRIVAGPAGHWRNLLLQSKSAFSRLSPVDKVDF